ncbi:hypothetical protein FHX52_2140 [Humibacillus xanthopallidus]|uniref:Uncharacterized protein n=1 Tax=Humibacillus xanthopallidus TaxID=412689 RepID=A0A543PY39_9MICO|nr:hypothetical protein FHX52_2140 [Humibacillus xanthopallidus]
MPFGAAAANAEFSSAETGRSDCDVGFAVWLLLPTRPAPRWDTVRRSSIRRALFVDRH